MDPNDALRKYAYSTAKDLTGASTIDSDDDLKSALGGYAEKQFKVRFGFDYKTNPPDYPSNPKVAPISRGQVLQYDQDDPGHTKLPGAVKFFFSSISIPDQIKALADGDLETQVKSVAEDHVVGDWAIGIFDKTYKYSPAAVRASGIVLYFFKHESTLMTTTSASYIYILGLFYEVVPIGPIIEVDLLKELSASLKDQIEGASVIDKTDWEDLTILLLKFAKQQFKRAFNFDWTGKESRVPEGVGLKIAYSTFLKFVDQPSDDQIKKRVGDSIFKRDGDEFPSKSVQAAIFDDLFDTIKYLSKSTELPKDDTKWFDVSHERSFPIDPSRANSEFVKQYTIFVYTVGTKSERDVNLRGDLTYYLTVFSKIPFPSPSPQ